VQTIKTGVVVALLLAVCYGAFVALNAPEPNLPDELLSEFDWSPEEAGLENLTSVEMPSAPSVALPVPPASGLNASGGFDASPSNPNSSALANSGLPSLPDLAGNMIGQAGSNEPLSSLSLPTLPTPGNTIPAANNTVTAPDGPAVSLATGTETDLASAYAMGASGASQTQPSGAIAPGQLVSQTRSAALDAAPTGQLPLLDGLPDSRVATPADTYQEQPTLPFPSAREQALKLASNGKLRDALHMLTRYYDSPELNAEQHADLVDLLDALSAQVIYSPRHLALPPYTIAASDTVEGLALTHQVTPELLTAINGLWKPLTPGSQIKVLPGPFRAVVSLSRYELTVFLGDLYAGRFPVSFGTDPSPVEGTYEIIDRRRDRTYYGTGGRVIPADDHLNPYGGFWLNLGQDLCIHGTPEMASDELHDAGCISLAPLDAADVYNILAKSSQVSIVR
jgi:hypothetical protein